MKLVTFGVALAASLAFAAGSALADMQPIPNPPEKAATTMHHEMHHHVHRTMHHRMHHKVRHAMHQAAKKVDAAAPK